MKTKSTILMLGAVLLFAGIAGAQLLPQPQTQVLLPGASIPKFVDPLPVGSAPDGTGITVVDATQGGAAYTPAMDNPFNITAYEFQAQILPTGMPASWVWGYLTDADIASLVATPIRASYLGPVVVAQKGVPFYPRYVNALPVGGLNVQQNLPIDMTLDWADPTPGGIVCDNNPLPPPGDPFWDNLQCGTIPPYMGPVPVATHLHGGEVLAAYDGGPDAWFTPGYLATGDGWPGEVYEYPNEQQESTIWFHDHALGITRLNVYAGLAGAYPIVDPGGPTAPLPTMPAGAYDIPLVIQDRSFDTNGQIFYNLASNPQPNPEVHPFWIPEFIGDTIVVNGKTWPYLNVEPRQYRFRFINGSNARFYELTFNMTKVKNLKVKAKNPTLPMVVIATDDGYLFKAVGTDMLVIGPGERYEVIVNFSALQAGDYVTMMNSARTPYPGGGKPVPGLTDTVMQFRVTGPPVADIPPIIAGAQIRQNPLQIIAQGHVATAVGPPLGADPGVIVRQLTLNEVIGPGGPLELVVNNSKFNLALNTPGCNTPECRETEIPAVGDTEIWEIINITADAHPMHTHLTSFQLVDRTPFQASTWISQYDAFLLANADPPGSDPAGAGPPFPYSVPNADGAIGGNPAIGSFLQLGKRRLPLPYEEGWKDTVITYPGEVTRIAIRWATTDTPVGAIVPGDNTYPFDPTSTLFSNGVGYVWHCHIIDHEDNEMMRNYTVGALRQPVF
jgi:FtsP/CotA-like multicopper oxidase with cupredoxin domain